MTALHDATHTAAAEVESVLEAETVVEHHEPKESWVRTILPPAITFVAFLGAWYAYSGLN